MSLTEKEFRREQIVRDYIDGLTWADDTSDHIKTLVIGNIRGFAAHVAKMNDELPEPEPITFDQMLATCPGTTLEQAIHWRAEITEGKTPWLDRLIQLLTLGVPK